MIKTPVFVIEDIEIHTENIDKFKFEFIDSFLTNVFDMDYGSVFLTDLSDIHDFCCDASDLAKAWKMIEHHYGLVEDDVVSERIVDVLAAIQKSKIKH